MEYTPSKCYTVTELTLLIKKQLEATYPDIMIEGEISNFRPSSTGHFYFSLKDKDSILSVVMFKNRLSTLTFQPADGMLVRATGSISVYPKRGSYQLICASLIKSGEGNILLMLEERKRKLAAEGLFDEERKKSLPLLPSKVAVITSPTGAAIRDILRVLKRRHSGLNLIILPSPVQGEEAAAMITEKIRIANLHKMADVLIIGRGGGSLEDLLPFYDENLVRAIAASEIPVISAVGHEIDFTLSDLAADMRAPTPSAAAEIVAAPREELLRRVLEASSGLKENLLTRIEKIKLVLEQFKPEILSRHFQYMYQSFQIRFDDARESVIRLIKEYLTGIHHRLELVSNKLHSYSPLDILKRGYSVVTESKTGKILRSSKEAAIGDNLDIQLYKGFIFAEVKDKENEK
jgi:exodeoxyribonuclease VII large subunit